MNSNPIDQIITAVCGKGQGAAKPILIIGGDDVQRSSILESVGAKLQTIPINLGVSLPAAILRQEAEWTPIRTPSLVSSMVPPGAPVILLDHIEVLFAPSLEIGVLELLTQLARRLPVCASWPGEASNARVRYARRDHPECVDADPSRIIIIDITNTES